MKCTCVKKVHCATIELLLVLLTGRMLSHKLVLAQLGLLSCPQYLQPTTALIPYNHSLIILNSTLN